MPARRPGAAGRFAPGKWAPFLLVSALLLVPCYWQSRIQAGDLSSHIYNAWLARLIRRGEAPGLSLAPQTTNILFDLMLDAGWSCTSAGWAQRLSVSLAVLVFFWGAWNFLRAMAGRERPWFLMPVLTMLAYGWVFQMGFFNFYLSLGLCLWALALALRGGPARWALAPPLAALAWTAHALPLAWGAAVLAYLLIAHRMRRPRRLALAGGAVLILGAVRWFLAARYQTMWLAGQVRLVTGADQFWVLDSKYVVIGNIMLGLWVVWLYRLCARYGAKEMAFDARVQLVVIHAAGLLLLPASVWFPGYQHALAYLPDRMSLAGAVMMLALLSDLPARRTELLVTALLAAVFFGCVYADSAALNRFEDRVEAALSAIPAQQRVIAVISLPTLRVNAFPHVIDRACIGRCFSYANYEPSSAAFRTRVRPGSPVVVSAYLDSDAIQTGAYTVRSGDLPLYVLRYCGRGADPCVEPLAAGDRPCLVEPRM